MAEALKDRPAFPSDSFRSTGMSLRDWFAGQAMAGGLSGYTANVLDQIPADKRERAFKIAATTAYEMADAMLRERERQ